MEKIKNNLNKIILAIIIILQIILYIGNNITNYIIYRYRTKKRIFPYG